MAVVIMHAALAFGVTSLAVVLLLPLAPRWGLLDVPGRGRKRHARPKPVLGVALGIGVLGASWWSVPVTTLVWTTSLGALGMLVLGLDDDRHPRAALWKLGVQTLIAAAVVLGAGVAFKRVSLLGFHLGLGWLALPFSVFWVVTLTNAFNLVDGSDGLAVGLSAIAAARFVGANDPQTAYLGASLLGGCVAFWGWNKPQAKAFLGDGGAYFLGTTLALLSLGQAASSRAEATFTFSEMGLLFLVPLADVICALARRAWRGQSIFAADHDHIHHRLEQRWGTWTMLVVLYGVTALGTLASLWWR